MSATTVLVPASPEIVAKLEGMIETGEQDAKNARAAINKHISEGGLELGYGHLGLLDLESRAHRDLDRNKSLLWALQQGYAVSVDLDTLRSLR